MLYTTLSILGKPYELCYLLGAALWEHDDDTLHCRLVASLNLREVVWVDVLTLQLGRKPRRVEHVLVLLAREFSSRSGRASSASE